MVMRKTYLYNYGDLRDLAAKLERRKVAKRIRIETNTKRVPTLAQAMQQMKFGVVSKFMCQAQEVVKIGYAGAYRKKTLSEVNQAFGIFLKTAIIGEYPDYRLDFSKIDVSVCNKLGGVNEPRLYISKSSVLKVTWSACALCSDRLDDRVVCFFYNESTGEGFSYLNSAKRGDYVFETKCRFVKKGDMLHCWVFIAGVHRKETSHCEYLKAIV